MDPVRDHNRKSWDSFVDKGNRWTLPTPPEAIADARRGTLNLLLTPTKPVPQNWYPDLKQLPTLCLATGGGQQAPLLAAAGAIVTTIDNSPKQLEQDRLVADRENLTIATVLGDMADLSMFDDGQFGLVFHACSNCFSQTILPVWKEAFRVLRPGGILMSGFNNPIRYAIADADHDRGHLELTRKLPWSDLTGLSESELKSQRYDVDETLEFGHTLEDQIGGQLNAGFVLTDFYEDRWSDESDPISDLMDTFIATRAMKP
ncbi:Methyltransferase domain protein [Planctomycetes bacterium K23_9]|uniref:Methyltransferase domain protein n=2 Tax=Stieleria marina TaxID=1930275 RepID=A0A517P0Q7_9BACT|nr:Methyltransferase domain protein [Planctomycetes bacterium K23_9]